MANELNTKKAPKNKINFHEEYLKNGVNETLKPFHDELIGLNEVKKRIKKMAVFLLLQLIRKRMKLLQNNTRSNNANMAFTGAPGTGKTVVARRFALLLFKLGVIPKGHLVVARREDLVGQYIGHTAPKTKAVLKKAEGGMLFLDNADKLYKRTNPRDYGFEVIELLLQYMENFRNNFVVIFAGYKSRVDKFLFKNPGLSARVLRHIHFRNYTIIELVLIAFLTCTNRHYKLNQEAMLAL